MCVYVCAVGIDPIVILSAAGFIVAEGSPIGKETSFSRMTWFPGSCIALSLSLPLLLFPTRLPPSVQSTTVRGETEEPVPRLGISRSDVRARSSIYREYSRVREESHAFKYRLRGSTSLSLYLFRTLAGLRF